MASGITASSPHGHSVPGLAVLASIYHSSPLYVEGICKGLVCFVSKPAATQGSPSLAVQVRAWGGVRQIKII